MSVKHAVFEFVEKHPEMSVDQIVKGLPELNKASVRKYYYDYQKLQVGPAEVSKTAKQKPAVKRADHGKSKKETGSIRLKVYSLLDNNASASIDDICREFEGCNRKTIRDYRNRWRSENSLADSGKEKKKKAKQTETGNERKAVYNYMKQHLNANLNDLRKAFPHHSKLVADFRSWKNQQAKKKRLASKETGDSPTTHLSVDSYNKTIQSLKLVIEKQRATIESQRLKLKQFRAQASKFNLDRLKSFLASKIFNK
jgi:transposase-like protein